MARRYAKKGLFICERSGFEYPIKYMVKEPGTNLIVCKYESDGKYNLVDHPQNFLKTKGGDGRPIKNARPLQSVEDNLLEVGDGNLLTLTPTIEQTGETLDTLEVQP